jgi:hypothetical protein
MFICRAWYAWVASAAAGLCGILNMKRITAAFSVLSVALIGVEADAAFTVYTNRAAFLAAGGTPMFEETFSENFAMVAGDNLYNDVNYRATPNKGANNIFGGRFIGDEFASVATPNETTSLEIILPQSVIAWGADFVSANSFNGIEFVINGTTIKIGDYLAAPGDGFFGVVFTSTFSSIDVRGSGATPNEFYNMDNMLWGGKIPAPGAMTLAACAGLFVARRRR